MTEVIDVKSEVQASEEAIGTDAANIIEILKNSSKRYMITLTLLSNDKLGHMVLTKNFPELDVLKSIAACEKIAVERLKSL